MKKILFILIVSLVAIMDFAHAAPIKTKLAAPFQTLNIDKKVWSLEESSKSFIAFNLVKDEAVFGIFQGLPLKKVSIEELILQIKKAHGNLNNVSLLNKSFPELEDPEDEESDIQHFEKIKINGIHGIKFDVNVTLGEEYPRLENGAVVTPKIIYPGIGYFLVTKNRIYAVSFIAPPEKFTDLEPLFEATMQHLFINP